MINPLRGMKDIAFEDAKKFNYIVDTIKGIVSRYGYEYLETPKLEETALFTRSVGESSDIVNKEMYNFKDKGDRDICLRPEGTAGAVRFFISNKLDRVGGKYKFFYYGSMFRYERPQKGRLREFHQFGCESFGEASVYEDYTIIEMVDKILKALKIDATLEINSLGCNDCMPTYTNNLVKFLESKRENLCEDCNKRLSTNPMRVLDCKNPNCKKELEESPKITDNLCENCDSDFKKLLKLLDSNNISYKVNKNLVRGLDYYNKTAFEFVSSNLGAQGTVAGGGRYDKLVEFLDGKPTPAIGFGMGIERVMELVDTPKDSEEIYYIGSLDSEYIDNIISIANSIRDNKKVILEYKAKKQHAHLKSASKVGATYCLIMGENEFKESSIWVKNLNTQSQDLIEINKFIETTK